MADPTSHQPMPPEMNATDLEVRALPLWAIVAWGARCARRVQPLLLSAWSERPSSDFEPVESAILFAESVARTPNRLASHVDRAKEIAFPAWTGSAKEDTRIACGFAAVRSAQSAAEAAIAARANFTKGNIRDDEESIRRVVLTAMGAAMQAHNAVASAFSDVHAHWAAMRLDRELLLSLAKENSWSDESPVDVALLGPLWPPGLEPEWAKGTPEPDERATRPVAAHELKELPHRAQVAFAARCARRAQPLFLLGWPDAPKHRVKSFNDSITATEAAARMIGPLDPTFLAALAVMADSDTPSPLTLLAVSVASSALEAAKAAANAQSGGTYDPPAWNASYAAQKCLAAYVAAMDIQGPMDIQSVRDAIRGDYERLAAKFKGKAKNDAEPVDVASLGPLWPPGIEPEWAKEGELKMEPEIGREQDVPRPPGKMILKFTVPPIENTPENRAKLIAHMKQSILAASAAHIAHGGSGLRIDDVKAWAAVAAGSPVPTGGSGGGR